MSDSQFESSELREIQAGNEQTRKKLLSFRAGLEKMMNKKTKKQSGTADKGNLSSHAKSNGFEAPSRDQPDYQRNQQASKKVHIYPQNFHCTGYASQKPIHSNHHLNGEQKQGSSTHSPLIKQESKFEYNSTLFKNITGNDSITVSNPSSLVDLKASGSSYNQWQFNNSPKNHYHPEHESVNSHNFDQSPFHSVGNTVSVATQNEQQIFKKSKQMFSEIDDLINKRKHTSTKLPAKSLEKYLSKADELSDYKDSQYETNKISSKSSEGFLQNYRTNLSDYESEKTNKSDKSKRQEYRIQSNVKNADNPVVYDKLKTIEQIQEENKKVSSRSTKHNREQKSYLPPLSNMKPQKSQKTTSANITPNYHQLDDQKEKLSPKKIRNDSENSSNVQIHKNRLQNVLSERKKALSGFGENCDDSIVWDLSDENEQEISDQILDNNEKFETKQQYEQIQKLEIFSVDELIKQKALLEARLKEIETELQKIQGQC